MNNFLKLTKFNVKYYLKPRFDDKKAKKRYIGLMCLLAFCFIAPIAMICVGIYYAMGIAAQMGIVPNIISFIFLVCQIMVIFFGGTKYLQITFFANDGEILSTLPLTSTQIFSSKLLTSYIGELIFSACTIVPIAVITAISLGMHGVVVGASFYITMFAAILIMPIAPIMIMSILAVPLVKMMTFFKKHPFFGAVLSVSIVIGILMAIYIPVLTLQTGLLPSTGEEVTDITAEIAKMLQPFANIGKYSFHTFAIANAMMGVSVGINYLIFCSVSIAILGVGIILSKIFYKSINNAMIDNAGAKIKVHKNEKQAIPKIAYAKAELKNLFRDQSMTVQILMSLIMPSLMVGIMTFVFSMQQNGVSTDDQSMLSGISLGFSLFMVMSMLPGSNLLAALGFSKEGEKFYLLKTMPLKSKDIVKLKLFVADISAVVSLFLASIVFAFSKTVWYDKILFFVMQVPYIMSINMFLLKNDIKNPKLKWVTLKEISKQNFSLLVPIIVSFLPGIIVTAVAIVLSFVANGLSQIAKSAILWGVMALIDILVYFIFRFRQAENCVEYFDRVEG